jgi:Spy/CpxP family protein refolding chaperone
MKRNLTIFGAVAAIAAGMLFAQTQTTPQHRGPDRAAAHQRMMQALNLTDAQKAQAKTIFDEAKQKAQPIRTQLQQNRQALNAAAKAGNSASIQQLANDEGKLLGQMIAIRTEAKAKFYSTLTPEQRTQYDQAQQKRHERMQQRFGKEKTGE